MTSPDQPLPEGVDLREQVARIIALKVIPEIQYVRTTAFPVLDQGEINEAADAILALPELRALRLPGGGKPIPMVLHCPRCGLQHVDATEDGDAEVEGGQTVSFDAGWANPPHRSHLCHGCGLIWRPADVPTEGVESIQTTGKADHPKADWSDSASVPACVSAAPPQSEVPSAWRDMDSAPREPRAPGWTCGPLIYVLMPYRPKPDWDVAWWCTYDKCFRFTGDDGPDDIQPTHWMPLASPAPSHGGKEDG